MDVPEAGTRLSCSALMLLVGRIVGTGGPIHLTSPSSGYEMRPQWECHLHSSQKGLQQWRKTHLMSPGKSLAKWEVIP